MRRKIFALVDGTTAARVTTMLPAFLGIAVVALPSGIITAGYWTA